MPEPTRGKQGRDRDGKPGRERGGRSREGMVTYRLAVGRNERVQPGSIVGAIANEGGITSKQIG
ncbi:DbpA RNA binding domain-containing protein, partial [Burkholderia multivorans]